MTLNATLLGQFILLLVIIVGVVAWRLAAGGWRLAAGAPQEPASRADHLPVRAALSVPAICHIGLADIGAAAGSARPRIRAAPVVAQAQAAAPIQKAP